LKYGVGVNHLPSGRFCANAVWMTLNVIAHNLGRWVGRIGLGLKATSMTTKTLRTRMLNLPGRMTTSVAGGPCTCRGHGRGRTSSTRSLPGCVPFPGRSFAYAPDPRATTASRHLCPAPADDGPPQPFTGPGPTRTLCRRGGSLRPLAGSSDPCEMVQCPRDDRQMSFGGSGLRDRPRRVCRALQHRQAASRP
jgi:hypothetical protein